MKYSPVGETRKQQSNISDICMIVLDPRVDLSVPSNIIPVSAYMVDKVECIIVKSMLCCDKSLVARTPMLGLWNSVDSQL